MAEAKPDLSGAGLRIGIVRARFNEAIGLAMQKACAARLKELGVTNVKTTSVPGALEAPLALQKLANTGHYDALVALGAVIRGETYHFEVVANESAAGIAGVQLEFGIPIGNGGLTCESDSQAEARMDAKGYEAAMAALELANLLDAIDKR